MRRPVGSNDWKTGPRRIATVGSQDPKSSKAVRSLTTREPWADGK